MNLLNKIFLDVGVVFVIAFVLLLTWPKLLWIYATKQSVRPGTEIEQFIVTGVCTLIAYVLIGSLIL